MNYKALLTSAYLLGAAAIAIAIYLILVPYSVTTYYIGPLRPMNISVDGNIVLIFINNTGESTIHIPVTVGESVLGVSFVNNATLVAGAHTVALYNFSYPKYVSFNQTFENVKITIKGIKIPLINKILTLIMIILFILMMALLIIGYLFYIQHSASRRSFTDRGILKNN
ncbi:hypothetical protein [Thermoproteus tenax]|uniref:Uncharacterized protein n=1 Tax=Thermoproteus tenax (strain ATCC 35583 / DSM 2078 / JCM 9277 / NBRC 100435 / Kra 1) TaxID=768679 RepID=G4RMK0_THETK|nr:hypothetical protein [Thermoproteus tenax]CCC80831.1 hypothetical protein TTX_0154 [Thermoproteus tenax Kra 1]